MKLFLTLYWKMVLIFKNWVLKIIILMLIASLIVYCLASILIGVIFQQNVSFLICFEYTFLLPLAIFLFFLIFILLPYCAVYCRIWMKRYKIGMYKLLRAIMEFDLMKVQNNRDWGEKEFDEWFEEQRKNIKNNTGG